MRPRRAAGLMFGGGARSRVSISGAATDKDVRNWLLRAVGSVGQVAALVRPGWVSRTPAAWRGDRGGPGGGGRAGWLGGVPRGLSGRAAPQVSRNRYTGERDPTGLLCSRGK